MTGVLFEAWRSDEHVAGTGGEADPLHGYLSAQILGQLPEADREFLVDTAVLDEVTAVRAIALGRARRRGAPRVVARGAPAGGWQDGGRALRCHPRFREYLLELLERRGAGGARAGGSRMAVCWPPRDTTRRRPRRCSRPAHRRRRSPTAERAIFAVVDRLDFGVAERGWRRCATSSRRGARRW